MSQPSAKVPFLSTRGEGLKKSRPKVKTHHATAAATPTILAVDDEPGLLKSYQHYLSKDRDSPKRPSLRSSRRRSGATASSKRSTSKAGTPNPRADYNVITASTGERAVEIVRELHGQGRRIDLGLFDMKMPGGIDGLETIRQILEIDPTIYCVIVTAYQDKPLEELAKVFGDEHKDQWDYINKPFTGNEVVQKASNMIAASQRQRAQFALEKGLRSSIDRFESDAQVRALELSIANTQLHSKQSELQGALDKLVETNSRLQIELKEKSRIERELQIAHKLEAVGQLAAGIAHEINIPTQYIGSNIHFLGEAFSDLQAVVSKFKEAYEARANEASCHELLLAAEKEADEVDIGFLYEEIPDAFCAISEGITTISTIVGAMRNFAHPDSEIKELGDINRAIDSTLAVAHSEYRYLAEIDSKLDDIPLVPCLLGGLNQVFLNLIVNAAHAIADSGKSVDDGIITIRTWADTQAGLLKITFKDNGCGMDEATKERIFDPFFTTKDVGRGTGQGLAIARDIVVDKHDGQLTADSVVGEGTVFTISLPL
ncbi:MAG: response regulator [Myxococcales bacterium]|nr:response regulator [Myxococcales bacterium]